jgi:3D (Asp-Asp-Asp) domain-containing protein
VLVKKVNYTFNIADLFRKQFPEPPHYKAKFVVTMYAKGEPDVTDTTFTGHKVRHGTVAVDPRFIPFGSKIYIPQLKFHGIADDVGGMIRRHHIDLYVTSRHQCNRFGRQKMDIIVYPSNKPLWRHRKRP